MLNNSAHLHDFKEYAAIKALHQKSMTVILNCTTTGILKVLFSSPKFVYKDKAYLVSLMIRSN